MFDICASGGGAASIAGIWRALGENARDKRTKMAMVSRRTRPERRRLK
jgi:hypothetical protein